MTVTEASIHLGHRSQATSLAGSHPTFQQNRTIGWRHTRPTSATHLFCCQRRASFEVFVRQVGKNLLVAEGSQCVPNNRGRSEKLPIYCQTIRNKHPSVAVLDELSTEASSHAKLRKSHDLRRLGVLNIETTVASQSKSTFVFFVAEPCSAESGILASFVSVKLSFQSLACARFLQKNKHVPLMPWDRTGYNYPHLAHCFPGLRANPSTRKGLLSPLPFRSSCDGFPNKG